MLRCLENYGFITEKIINMHVTFKTFQSGVGDCIFLLLNQGEVQLSVMVDCGKLTDDIASYIKNDLNNTINLLIVTHIDNDHIIGVRDMLKKDGIKVGQIVFNCYQRNTIGGVKKLNKYQKERLAEIENEIGLVVGDLIEHDVDAPAAMKGLAATILGYPKLKKVWGRDYTVCGDFVDLKEFGTITFLSPTIDELEKLDKEFRHVLFDELNVDKTLGKWDAKENLYEILLRYAMLQTPSVEGEKEKDVLGAISLEDRLMKAAAIPVSTQEITPANHASLAFVWEKDDHRILVMGDANPDVVMNGLLDYYKGKAFPVLFDAVKVSHHGSHFNTTNELMRHVDSEHFFFTGGTEGKRPSEEAVGRIALRPLTNGINYRTMHFNYPTSLIKELQDDKELQNKYSFKIDTRKNEWVLAF